MESLATLKTGLGGPLVCEVWGWRRFIQVHSVHAFFFFFHQWFSGQVGELYVTVHYVCHCVFKLGQNVLRCSVIVGEERLFLIFFLRYILLMCIYIFMPFKRWLVLCNKWWVCFLAAICLAFLKGSDYV